jgi:hypothetical protein
VCGCVHLAGGAHRGVHTGVCTQGGAHMSVLAILPFNVDALSWPTCGAKAPRIARLAQVCAPGTVAQEHWLRDG